MILVGKPEGTRLEILRLRWEDKIKMDLKELRLGENVDWIDVAQRRCKWQAIVSAANVCAILFIIIHCVNPPPPQTILISAVRDHLVCFCYPSLTFIHIGTLGT